MSRIIGYVAVVVKVICVDKENRLKEPVVREEDHWWRCGAMVCVSVAEAWTVLQRTSITKHTTVYDELVPLIRRGGTGRPRSV